MLPTVREILALPVMQRGDLRLVAGAQNLDRPVRWVHVSELSDIAHLLTGGELILTTGIGLPDSAAGLRGYVREMSQAGVAALVVELERRYVEGLPSALIEAAEGHGVPLVALRRETSFMSITQAVHAVIIESQMSQLLAAEEAQRAFSALAVSGADAQAVVDLVARMAGAPTVYENLVHQVLVWSSAGRDPDVVLGDWERRSRAALATPDGTAGEGRITTLVGAPGEQFGRLVLLVDEPGPRHHMLLERAAQVLVIRRLIDRDHESLERQSHRTLVTALLTSMLAADEVAVRSQALGVPLTGRQLTGVAVHLRDDAAGAQRALGELITTELSRLGVPALVGTVDSGHVAALLSQAPGCRPDAALDELAARIRAARADDATPPVVGVGPTVSTPAAAHETLRGALEVAGSVAGRRGAGPGRGWWRVADLGLGGLLHQLREDEHLQAYVEGTLGPLLEHDARHDGDLTEVLTAYCHRGGNKTAAAAEVHLSRAALYDRIERIERLLRVDLSDPEVITGYHLALQARRVMRQTD